jgi:hypothetical protein
MMTDGVEDDKMYGINSGHWKIITFANNQSNGLKERDTLGDVVIDGAIFQ